MCPRNDAVARKRKRNVIRKEVMENFTLFQRRMWAYNEDGLLCLNFLCNDYMCLHMSRIAP